MNTRALFTITALCGLAAPVAAQDIVIDTFEGGVNIGGWSIGPFDAIEPTGGNPDAWLHSPGLDTFAPIVRTDESIPSAFVGDYRAMAVTMISLDAQLINRDWGDPVGFELCVLLRDTKGTPDVDDDDYAYTVGPNVPLMGQGWMHYDYEIPADSVEPVPAGWYGGWVGDPENFRPGIDWNDVIVSVDRLEIWWIHPAFFGIFAQWDVGVDNIAITMNGGGNPCPADINGDSAVDVLDLLDLFAAWGAAGGPEDINGDGVVDVQDLLELFASWGPCP